MMKHSKKSSKNEKKILINSIKKKIYNIIR